MDQHKKFWDMRSWFPLQSCGNVSELDGLRIYRRQIIYCSDIVCGVFWFSRTDEAFIIPVRMVSTHRISGPFAPEWSLKLDEICENMGENKQGERKMNRYIANKCKE